MTSRRGRFANADTVTGSGSYPQTVEEAIWIAVEQTTLDGAIDDSQEIITFAARRFTSAEHLYIIVDSEVMLLSSESGNLERTVTRAQKSTSAASHADGATVYAWYNTTGGVLQAVDTESEGKDGWVTYKPDGGSYASTQRLPAIAYNESKKYWRKVIIPAGTEAEWYDDLIDRIANVTIDEAA